MHICFPKHTSGWNFRQMYPRTLIDFYFGGISLHHRWLYHIMATYATVQQSVGKGSSLFQGPPAKLSIYCLFQPPFKPRGCGLVSSLTYRRLNWQYFSGGVKLAELFQTKKGNIKLKLPTLILFPLLDSFNSHPL